MPFGSCAVWVLRRLGPALYGPCAVWVLRLYCLRRSGVCAVLAVRPQPFVREIRMAERLNHPHILPLYDSGESEGFLYFVMPVMQGQTLRDRLELLEWAVDHGFYPYRFFAEWCLFMAPLRGAEFDCVVAKAARRVAEFSA